jgi:hypothetical protein
MLQCIAIYPRGDRLVAGDTGGAIYLIELLGIKLSSPVMTAVKRGEEITLCCPACFNVVKLEQEWLGMEIPCPVPNCGSQMRINPFVANSAFLNTR